MKKKSEILRKRITIISLFSGVIIFLLLRWQSYYILYNICMSFGLAVILDCMLESKFLIPLEFKEKIEEAKQQIKQAFNGHKYREVRYLCKDRKAIDMQELGYLAMHNNEFRFIAKLCNDDKVSLLVVDSYNKEIKKVIIHNPVFFMDNFEFI